jgi:hypothetical protein
MFDYMEQKTPFLAICSILTHFITFQYNLSIEYSSKQIKLRKNFTVPDYQNDTLSGIERVSTFSTSKIKLALIRTSKRR